MEYRLVDSQDLPLLRDLLQILADHHNRVAESFSGWYPVRPIDDQLRELGEQIDLGKGRVEAAFDQGKLIGFCAATHEEKYGDIDFLIVLEEYRGRGIGARLLDDILGYFREVGVDFVDLRIVLGNNARKFYEKHGFRLRSLVYSREIEP